MNKLRILVILLLIPLMSLEARRKKTAHQLEMEINDIFEQKFHLKDHEKPKLTFWGGTKYKTGYSAAYAKELEKFITLLNSVDYIKNLKKVKQIDFAQRNIKSYSDDEKIILSISKDENARDWIKHISRDPENELHYIAYKNQDNKDTEGLIKKLLGKNYKYHELNKQICKQLKKIKDRKNLKSFSEEAEKKYYKYHEELKEFSQGKRKEKPRNPMLDIFKSDLIGDIEFTNLIDSDSNGEDDIVKIVLFPKKRPPAWLEYSMYSMGEDSMFEAKLVKSPIYNGFYGSTHYVGYLDTDCNTTEVGGDKEDQSLSFSIVDGELVEYQINNPDYYTPEQCDKSAKITSNEIDTLENNVNDAEGKFLIGVIDTGFAYNDPEYAKYIVGNPKDKQEATELKNKAYPLLNELHDITSSEILIIKEDYSSEAEYQDALKALKIRREDVIEKIYALRNKHPAFDFKEADFSPFDYSSSVFGDTSNHGTHVASRIIDENKKYNKGKTNFQIIPIKFGRKGTPLLNYEREIDFLASKGVKVINMSLGSEDERYVPFLKEAIRKHPEITFVVAAGNEEDGKGLGDNDKTKRFPASYTEEFPNVITVAAVDKEKKFASFSNYGVNSVDVAAEGVEINSRVPGQRYDNYSGTSMATPYVASVVGELREQFPTLTAEEIKETITKGSLLEITKSDQKYYTNKIKGGVITFDKAINYASTHFPSKKKK